jgi:hypothetical protein
MIMIVLVTELKSKTLGGRSAFQCSMCCIFIPSNTDSAKTCGTVRSLECQKHSVMCCGCFGKSKHNCHNSLLLLYLAAERESHLYLCTQENNSAVAALFDSSSSPVSVDGIPVVLTTHQIAEQSAKKAERL